MRETMRRSYPSDIPGGVALIPLYVLAILSVAAVAGGRPSPGALEDAPGIAVTARTPHAPGDGRAVDRQDGALIQAGEGAETGRDLPRESALDTLRHGRDAGAIPDVLRAAEAFAAHGDLGLAGQAVAIAERLAGQARDEDALARARAIRADLTATTLAAGRFRIEAF